MRLSRGQYIVLVFAVIFFSLQFLPHRFTTLVASGFEFFYLPVALLFILSILVGTAFSLLLWIAAPNEFSARYRRNWCVTFVLTILIAIGLTGGSFAYARGLPTGSFARTFDEKAWAASPRYVENDITERQKMLGSAIHNAVINRQKDEIIKSLGLPDESPFSTAGDLVYCLGPQRSGFAIDDEWLLIWFDDRGRVVRYDIWTD